MVHSNLYACVDNVIFRVPQSLRILNGSFLVVSLLLALCHGHWVAGVTVQLPTSISGNVSGHCLVPSLASPPLSLSLSRSWWPLTLNQHLK